jgi:hypothetical protein
MNRAEVFTACRKHLESSLTTYQDEYSRVQESLKQEDKCTAGDKHHTGRAILQLETEKLGKLISEKEKDLQFLDQLATMEVSTDSVQLASIIQTNKGWFFIGLGLGKIQISPSESLFALSIKAPICQKILHLKVSDKTEFNGQSIHIQNIL